MQQGVEIFYDGQCPLCSAYVRMLNLRRAVGVVYLIDARGDDPRVAMLKAAGIDLNEGMVLRHGAQIYNGAEAMRMLSILSSSGGILRAIMRSPRRAALVYPLLVRGRALLLRALGRAPIG